MIPALLLLSMALTAPIPRADLPPPPSVAAALLLEDGDPSAAAGIFEALWIGEQDPIALVHAGLSRAQAGDAAHAAAYLTEALALEFPPRLAEVARAALADARGETRLITITMHLRGTGPLELTLTRAGRTAPSLRFQLTPPPGEHVLPVALDPGPWLVELRRGAWIATREADVGPDLRDLAFAEPGPASRPPPPYARPLRLAGLITGGSLVALGAGLLAAGEHRIQQNFAALDNINTCSSATRCAQSFDGAAWRAAGAGLLGTGLGVATGALGTFFKKSRARRIAWSVDIAVGGALVGASFFGGLAGAAFNRAGQHPVSPDALAAPLAQHTAAAALLGLGLGLATSATLGLVLDRVDTRARLRAHLGPTGLALTGQF